MCNTTEDCLVLGEVPKQCIKVVTLVEDEFICDCTPLYGWKGINCTEPSVQTYLYRVTFFICIVWISWIVWKTLYLLYSCIQLMHIKIIGVRRVIFLLLLNLISSFFAFAGSVCFLQHNYNSSDFNLQNYRGLTFIAKNFTLFSYIMMYMPVFTVMLGALVKVVNWFTLLKKVGHVFNNQELREEKRLIKMLYIFVPVALIIIPGLLILKFIEIAIIVGGTLAFTVLFFYIYMLRQFLKPMATIIAATSNRSYSTRGNRLVEAYDFIVFTNKIFIGIATVTLIAASLNITLTIIEIQNAEQKDISAASIFLLIYALSGLCYLTFEVWCARKLLANISQAKR